VVACVRAVGANINASGPKKKAEDIPPPPRHAEVVETFNTLASNLAELASVSRHPGPGLAIQNGGSLSGLTRRRALRHSWRGRRGQRRCRRRSTIWGRDHDRDRDRVGSGAGQCRGHFRRQRTILGFGDTLHLHSYNPRTWYVILSLWRHTCSDQWRRSVWRRTRQYMSWSLRAMLSMSSRGVHLTRPSAHSAHFP
jgi:hypothetical protein